VPRRVEDQLASLLLRARQADTERELRMLASTTTAEVDVEEATATQMLRPLKLLLDTVGDGVKLTAAGYLPPALVQMIFDELDLGQEWIGKGNREHLTMPVLHLRATAHRHARRDRAGSGCTHPTEAVKDPPHRARLGSGGWPALGTAHECVAPGW